MNDFDFSSFVALEGHTFDVQSDVEGEIYTSLKLIEVAKLPHGHDARPEPFSLIFEGRKDLPLDQSTYCLHHSTLGLQSIFLVPIGERDELRIYQSIFN